MDARIAEAWTRDALMEHASIASFARFTLELLAVGAPADLVAGSQQAGLDEVGHTKACFQIASRLAGRPLGPGLLDVSNAPPATELVEVAVATLREGCIGETCSALLAEAREEKAEDPQIKQALAMIAREEASHARLAWRFIGWAVDRGGQPVRGAIVRAFEQSLQHREAAGPDTLGDLPITMVRAHGLLDRATARATVNRALDEVIAPLISDLRRVPRSRSLQALQGETR